MKAWAVDPGGVHVGMAEFEFGKDADGDDYADCTRAWELDPETAIDTIAAALINYEIDVLVVEEFRLYPDKAMAQTGSTMPTCELIGQIKWAHRLDCRRRHREFDRLRAVKSRARSHLDAIARVQSTVEFVLQPAAIQKPTTGVLRQRGIKSTAKATGAGGHALSAELHGWHYLIRVWFKKEA
jgi:hypothetical protein